MVKRGKKNRARPSPPFQAMLKRYIFSYMSPSLMCLLAHVSCGYVCVREWPKAEQIGTFKGSYDYGINVPHALPFLCIGRSRSWPQFHINPVLWWVLGPVCGNFGAPCTLSCFLYVYMFVVTH